MTTFQRALDHHRAGEIEVAEKLYRQVLRIDPHHAEGLHRLGVVALQQNRCQSAVDFLRRAIAEDATHPLYHSNLGTVYRDLGEVEQAIRSFHAAIRLAPDFAGAHYNLGLALASVQRNAEAVDALQDAVRHNPEFSDAWSSLGSVLAVCGHPTAAVDCFNRALELDPAAADVYYNRGNVLCALKRFNEAIADYHTAIERSPNRSEFWNNLGTAFKESGRFAESLAALRRALILAPESTETYNNLGAVYQFQGAVHTAVDCYRRAIAIDPGFCFPHTNLGNVAADRGHSEEAVGHYDEALHIDPKSAEANYNRCLELLRMGRFVDGWSSHHWRWERQVLRRTFPGPEWDGTDLSARTILVYGEQGIGDEIMFASCLPDVIERAGHCVIECDSRLVALMARSFPTASVTARPFNVSVTHSTPTWAKSGRARFDVHAAMGSLPKFFRTEETAFRRTGGYLVPDATSVGRWKARYDACGASPRIGISWRGGSEPDARRKRSTRLEQWQQILTLPGSTFVNLQYGDCREELAALKSAFGVTVHDWSDADPLTDLDGFAAQISALDLVISVDNSTVHMAGAIGKPVWTLLPFASDWRWMRDREDSPWYSDMRLFRQTSAGNWDGLFSRVCQKLRTQFSLNESRLHVFDKIGPTGLPVVFSTHAVNNTVQ